MGRDKGGKDEKRESEVRGGTGKAKAGRRKQNEEKKTPPSLAHHRVQQPVLRLHLAVDARGHSPQGPDALPQGVDASVVFPLEGLGVDLWKRCRVF